MSTGTKKKFSTKQTTFVTNIAGQDYKFAALSMRDMEHFAAEETNAKGDASAMKTVHRELVATALTRGGTEATADDIADMDLPLFSALFGKIMEAHGMKLDATVGEAKPL